MLLDPRHLDIYEAEVIVAVSTIKSDSVYGKVRAQLEVDVAGTDELDRNQKAKNFPSELPAVQSPVGTIELVYNFSLPGSVSCCRLTTRISTGGRRRPCSPSS